MTNNCQHQTIKHRFLVAAYVPINAQSQTGQAQAISFGCPASMPSVMLWLRMHAQSLHNVEVLSKVARSHWRGTTERTPCHFYPVSIYSVLSLEVYLIFICMEDVSVDWRQLGF